METNTLPLHSKDLLPTTKRDFSLFIFMTSAITFFFFWELFVVIPEYHQSLDWLVFLHISCGTFITLNIFGNIYYVKRVEATGKQSNLPPVLLQGWTYCYICQANAPPRAHHCTLCKECILKRDHHCMFTGCCIGYSNHRYYIMTVFYIFIGALYCVILHWEYSLSVISTSGWWTVLAVIAPHFALLAGTINLSGFAVVSLHTLTMVTVVMMGYLLSQQFLCIRNGQTLYEKREGIFDYNLGFKKNFIEVFGTSWWKAVFWPWVASTLPGNGIHFPILLENIKDI